MSDEIKAFPDDDLSTIPRDGDFLHSKHGIVTSSPKGNILIRMNLVLYCIIIIILGHIFQRKSVLLKVVMHQKNEENVSQGFK